MFRRLAIPGLVFGRLLANQAQWSAVQLVAWMQMIADYSAQTGSMRAGVAKTFSGEAPCKLCGAVARQQSSEDGRPALAGKDAPKPVLLCARPDALVFPPDHAALPVDGVMMADGPREPPPLTPPRA